MRFEHIAPVDQHNAFRSLQSPLQLKQCVQVGVEVKVRHRPRRRHQGLDDAAQMLVGHRLRVLLEVDQLEQLPTGFMAQAGWLVRRGVRHLPAPQVHIERPYSP